MTTNYQRYKSAKNHVQHDLPSQFTLAISI